MAGRRTRELKGVLRRYTFKLYPNKAQAEALDRHRRLHCAVWNACVAQRKDHERHERVRLGIPFYGRGDWTGSRPGPSGFDQGAEITVLRRELPEFREIGSTCLANTVRRVEKAFDLLKARRKKGQRGGEPRFQRAADYPGFSCSSVFRRGHYVWNGWAWTPASNGHKGRVTILGIPGAIKARGCLPSKPIGFVGADFLWDGVCWQMSLVVEMPRRRHRRSIEKGEIRFDLIDSFARVERVDGGPAAGQERAEATAEALIDGRSDGANRRLAQPSHADFSAPEGLVSFPKQGDRLGSGSDPGELGADQGATGVGSSTLTGSDPGELQRAMARCKRGSHRYRTLKLRKKHLQAHQARQRREQLHLWSTSIIHGFGDLTVICPKITAVTKSGKGNARCWGAFVKTKAALNRHVLGQAPAAAVAMLQYKASEAGIRCDVVEDQNSPVAVGDELITSKQAARKAARLIKKEKI